MQMHQLEEVAIPLERCALCSKSSYTQTLMMRLNISGNSILKRRKSPMQMATMRALGPGLYQQQA